jgi:hypothetical protein
MTELRLAYDPSQVKPGWVAFGVVVALCLVTFLLWRSMNHQLGKIKMPPSEPTTRRGFERRRDGYPSAGGDPATTGHPGITGDGDNRGHVPGQPVQPESGDDGPAARG